GGGRRGEARLRPGGEDLTTRHGARGAFFASVGQRDRPGLRSKPVLVGGSAGRRGVLSAASDATEPMPKARGRLYNACEHGFTLRAQVSSKVFHGVTRGRGRGRTRCPAAAPAPAAGAGRGAGGAGAPPGAGPAGGGGATRGRWMPGGAGPGGRGGGQPGGRPRFAPAAGRGMRGAEGSPP